MMRIGAVALSAALVMGCNLDQQTAPPGLATRAAVGGQELVTTGGADIFFKKGDIVNRLSFVAHREALEKLLDATAEGQFEYTGLIGAGDPKPCKDPPCLPTGVDTDGQIHGVVTCLMIHDKNRATVAGVITHSTDPKLEGRAVFWDVTDNGEGAGTSPDMSSILVLGDSKLACQKTLPLDVFPVETGNVQVHPAS